MARSFLMVFGPKAQYEAACMDAEFGSLVDSSARSVSHMIELAMEAIGRGKKESVVLFSIEDDKSVSHVGWNPIWTGLDHSENWTHPTITEDDVMDFRIEPVESIDKRRDKCIDIIKDIRAMLSGAPTRRRLGLKMNPIYSKPLNLP